MVLSNCKLASMIVFYVVCRCAFWIHCWNKQMESCKLSPFWLKAPPVLSNHKYSSLEYGCQTCEMN